jgi:hypothetical protein
MEKEDTNDRRGKYGGNNTSVERTLFALILVLQHRTSPIIMAA